MNNNPRPTQADEYRELSSNLRGKDRVLASIFTAWWAVNGIMIVGMFTAETLSAIVLMLIGFFGVIINFALHFHVEAIIHRYRKEVERINEIIPPVGSREIEPYRWGWFPWLNTRRIYAVTGILLMIWLSKKSCLW